MGDPLRAFELDAEQQLAVGVERPGIAALQVLFRRNPPYRSRSRFRPAAAGADPEAPVARLCGLPAHSLARRRQRPIDAGRLIRIAPAFDKGPARRRRLPPAPQPPTPPPAHPPP